MDKTIGMKTSIRNYPKWTAMLERHRQKNLFERDGALLALGGLTWGKFKARMKGKTEMEKIVAVNELWNQRPWKSDAANWKEEDKWATPLEFCFKGGDCEDYAIAKMLTLKALGVKLPMKMCVGIRKGKGHAVLTVDVDGRRLVLDNEEKGIVDEDRYDFTPMYSLAENEAWIYLKEASK